VVGVVSVVELELAFSSLAVDVDGAGEWVVGMVEEIISVVSGVVSNSGQPLKEYSQTSDVFTMIFSMSTKSGSFSAIKSIWKSLI